MASIREWKVRQPLDESDPVKLYGSSNHTYFSICLYHGGRFNGGPDNRGYSPQRMTYIDYVNVNLLCKSTFQEIVESLGYQEPVYFYRVSPGETIDYGLICLDKWADFDAFYYHIVEDRFNFTYRIFVETGRPTITRSYPDSYLRASPTKIYDMIIMWVQDNYPNNCSLEATRTYLLGETGVLIPERVVRPGWNRACEEIDWLRSQGRVRL